MGFYFQINPVLFSLNNYSTIFSRIWLKYSMLYYLTMAKLKIIRTYFLEILLLFTFTIVTTIVMLSWFLNYHFEKSITQIVNELNQDFLSESHRINEYLQKMIKISGMELFFEPSIQKLMYLDELTNFEIVSGIRRLDAVMSTNIHTQSIYVYNATKEYLYATSNMDSNLLKNFKDSRIQALLTGSADQSRLSPIPRYALGPTGEIPVYSFIFYDIQRTEPHIRGALIINITLDWLREVFKDVDMSLSQVMFVDEMGVIAYHTDTSLFLKNIANTQMFQHMISKEDHAGYFLLNTNGEKQYVFYSKSEGSPLYMMRIYPYDTVMGSIITLRRSTFVLVLVCISLAMALAVLMSRRLYKPIRQLVRRVDTTSAGQLRQGDLRYLSTSIDRMLTEAESFEETTQLYRQQLQTDVLREVLMGKIGDPQQVQEQFKEYKLPFEPDIPYQMIGLHPFEQSSITLLGNDVMGVQFNGSSLLLITQNLLSHQLKELAENALAHGSRMAILSRRIEHPYQLARKASQILEELRFSFIYTQGAILEERELQRSLSSGVYPTEVEKELVQHLKRGHLEKAYTLYQEFFNLVTQHSFNHFRFAMKRFYISLQLSIKELQGIGCCVNYQEPGLEHFENSLDTIVERETLDTFFFTWFEYVQGETLLYRNVRNNAIATQVKAVVDNEYANPNICLQYVADAVELSPTYVSKIFKASEGISFSDYCLQFRMEKAAYLLSKTDVPIKNIATAVGFSSETYFYTVFRKQLGITPNEYRQQVRL